MQRSHTAVLLVIATVGSWNCHDSDRSQSARSTSDPAAVLEQRLRRAAKLLPNSYSGPSGYAASGSEILAIGPVDDEAIRTAFHSLTTKNLDSHDYLQQNPVRLLTVARLYLLTRYKVPAISNVPKEDFYGPIEPLDKKVEKLDGHWPWIGTGATRQLTGFGSLGSGKWKLDLDGVLKIYQENAIRDDLR